MGDGVRPNRRTRFVRLQMMTPRREDLPRRIASRQESLDKFKRMKTATQASSRGAVHEGCHHLGYPWKLCSSPGY